MSIKLGTTDINKIYLGSTEIKKAYLGNNLIYDKTGGGGFVPTASTKAWYKFENDGLDSSGLGNNLTTFNNISFTAGIDGQAAVANGTSSLALTSNNVDISGTAQTIIFSVKKSGNFIDGGAVVEQRSTGIGGREICIRSSNNGGFPATSLNRFGWRMLRDGQGWDGNYIESSDITDNQWHRVAFTRNSNVAKCYVDGILVNSITNFDTNAYLSRPMSVFRNCFSGGDGGASQAGTYDNIILENREWNSTEITADFALFPNS